MASTAAARRVWPSLPAWARLTHPIVSAELRRLGRMRWLNLGHVGLFSLGLLTLLLILPALCTALLVGPATLRADGLLVVGGALALTAVAASALINWLTGLAATIVGATQIAQEREEQRWAFLRVTTLRSVDIVGGKLAALLRLLARRMHLAAGLRLFALLVAGATLIAFAATGGAPSVNFDDALQAIGGIVPALPVSFFLAASAGAADVLLALLFWLVEPYLNGAYSAVVGLAASTLARRRGPAIALAFAAHLGLALVVYWPAQQFAYLLLARLAALAPDVTLILLAAGLASIGVLAGLQTAVMLGCLGLAVQRVEHLPD